MTAKPLTTKNLPKEYGEYLLDVLADQRYFNLVIKVHNYEITIEEETTKKYMVVTKSGDKFAIVVRP